MNKTYILLIALFVILGRYTAQGQENFKSTVTITKEYEGKMDDVQKSKFRTSYSDTLLKFNLKFDYSAFDRPYKDLYEFSPVEGIRLQKKGDVRYPFIFFRGAVSYPWMPMADLYIQPRLGSGNSLVLYGNHDSFWGNNDLVGGPVNRSRTKGGMGYGYNWSKGELRVDGFYKYDYHLFNKSSSYNHGAQNTQNAGGKVLLRSLNPDRNSFYYNLNLGYVYTESQHSAKENKMDASLDLGLRVKGSHRINLGVDWNQSIYTTRLFNQNYGSEVILTNGIVQIVPQYMFVRPRINLSAGLSMGVMYSKIDGDSGFGKLYPKVNFSFEAVKNSLWLKLKVDGENKFYSAYDMLNMNPWIDVDKVENVYIPVRAILGLSGVVKDVFGYNIEGGYVYHAQFVSFYGVHDLQRVYVTEGVNEWKASADMMLKTDFLEVVLKGEYRNFGDALIYMVPEMNFEGKVKYNYKGRIYAEVGAKYYSQMKGKGVSYKGFLDLGANFTYAINSKLSIFAQGKNLLNNKIFFIQDYVEPGLNFGLGVVVKL